MISDFGTTQDGLRIRKATLRAAGGLQAEVIEYGAALQAIRVPVGEGYKNILLGFETLAGYEADTSYQGVIVGRYANRLDQARFIIDGATYHVTANEGANCLHGGTRGLSKRAWQLDEGATTATSTMLTYCSPAGEEGFPGEAQFRAIFTLQDNVLTIAYEAEVSQPTPLNLCHHLYFNLNGQPRTTILNHELSIAAAAMTPVRPDLIPLGTQRPVAGTPFDLQQPRRIGETIAGNDAQLQLSRGRGQYDGFDHNWVLSDWQPVLTLRSPMSGIMLEIETTQPGMQVYTSQMLEVPHFVRYGGLVLEPQNFPDAPNQPTFPDTTARPSAPYRQQTTYRFSLTNQ